MALDISAGGALQRRVALQTRMLAASHTTLRRTGRTASGKQIHSEIRSYLRKASDQGLIREPPEKIYKELICFEADARGYVDIAIGTVRNFKRTTDLPHFTRRDGGWFDFQLQVKEGDGQAEIIAYDFELRLPAGSGFEFLRFDLNPPGHENQDDGLRSHLHLNSDDDGLAVPAPMMSPYEILDLFLHGLRRVGRIRRTPPAPDQAAGDGSNPA